MGMDLPLNFDNPTIPTKKLIDSARMIYQELIMEHVPIKVVEKVVVDKFMVPYSNFKYFIREIVDVCKNGERVTFSEGVRGVMVDAEGEVTVRYYCYFGDVPLEKELILPPQISLYTLSIGVVSEYYFRIGLVDEALFYKTRYENSILNLTRRLKSIRIPPRRFI